MTRFRHIYSGATMMSEKEAVAMALKRDPRIQKTTIFEDTSDFLSCKIKSKHGFEGILLSKVPLRTFHCIYQNSVWIPFYLGRYYAIFIDGGQNFPGYLTKNVSFEDQKESANDSITYDANGEILSDLARESFEENHCPEEHIQKEDMKSPVLEEPIRLETIEVSSLDEYFEEKSQLS